MLQGAIPLTCPTKYADQFEQPVTTLELFSALRSGARHKTPDTDEFSLEFYTANRETINHKPGPPWATESDVSTQKKITPQQKHDIIVCLPQSSGHWTPDGHRLVSFPTTEYKLLARIMAYRLRRVLKDHLHTSQYCGVPGNSILEAASLVRDAIAYSESSGSPLCVLTLDFQHAFDRISHRYFFILF